MTELSNFIASLITTTEGGPRFAPAGDVPGTLAEAYAVQSAVSAHFGAVGGFKTARKPDQESIMAPIRRDRVFGSGADFPVSDQVGLELEIGFEVLAPIPAGTDAAGISQYLRPRPVIELVDTRVHGEFAEDPLVKLADMQLNAGLVLGAPLLDWDGSDFSTLTARMICADETILDGPTEVPGGSALTTVAELAKVIGDHCGGLQPGQVVITGTLHPLVYFPAGTVVSGDIVGLGPVTVNLL